MLKRILVPLDGSPLSEQSIPTALFLAERDGAEVEVVHALEALPESYVEEVGDWARDRTNRPVTAKLLTGRAKDALIEHIELRNPDLVIMTTHGRGGLTSAWLGGVATHLMHHVQAPMLLFKPDEERGRDAAPHRFERVLAPVDTTMEGERAIDNARNVAGEAAHFIVLHVLHPAVPFAPDAYGVMPPINEAELLANAERYLGDLTERLKLRGLDCKAKIVWDARTASRILDVVKEEDADLISLETHGRRGLERLLLGSVADKVVRGAEVPVLLQRPGT